ncbi:MAG: helix-turn-helix domain-containing protein [Clostridia bacterium]|nr:helix-turn-helix domain-containing protein [Clostridia bacterium]
MNSNLYTLEQVQEILELVQKYGVNPAHLTRNSEPSNIENSIISQQPSQETKLTLSVREAAALIGISKEKVYELINDGELPAIHIGPKRVIPWQAILDWVEKGMNHDG